MHAFASSLLQTSYLELCECRGWTLVEKAPKAAIKHLVAVLQPPALKSRVEDALRLEKNDLKDDFFGFADFLADEAEVCEKYHPLRAYRSSPKSNRAKGTEDEKKTRFFLFLVPDFRQGRETQAPRFP